PPIWLSLRVPCRICTITTRIHETRIAVPATKGVQLNGAPIFAPAVIDEAASTFALNGMNFGRFDHGPVQATTTATSMMIGSQAVKSSPAVGPGASAWGRRAAGWPP